MGAERGAARGFEALIEVSPLAIVRLDREGRVTGWNPAAERMFGWSSQEVLGETSPIVPEEKRDEYRAVCRRALGGETVAGFEALCRTKDGGEVTVGVSVSPLWDEAGEVEGCMGVFLDVTGRKRAERELAESARRLEQVFEQSVDALFIHDERGNVVDCNREACRSLGYSREELVGMNVHDFWRPASERREPPESIWRSFVSGEREDVAFLFGEHVRKDDTVFLAEVRLGPVDYNGGRMVLSSARDVTERETALEEVRRLNRQNQLLLDSAGEGIYGVDREMRITFANPAVTRMTGWRQEELVGNVSHDLIRHTRPGGHRRKLEESPIFETIQSGESRRITSDVLWRKNGASFPVEYSSTPMREGAEISGAVVVFSDVTGRKRAEKLLRDREERFRVLFQNSSDVILIAGKDRTIRYASPSAGRVMGYKPEELVGQTLYDYIHPEDRERVFRETSEIHRKPGVSPITELRWRNANGDWRTHEMIGNNLMHEPSIRGVVYNLRDVTERKVLEEQLAYQAFHDSLTGLPNRVLFMDRLDQALKRSRRREETVATLFLDLDNFKMVNDTLGHEYGDLLLAEAALRIRECLRDEDTAARFGGDEFTVLLENISGVDDATLVAERIHDALKEPVMLGGHEVFVTTSIGISLNTTGEETPRDLLRHADIAVYQAKERGRDAHTIFEPEMNERALEQMVLAGDLKRALERDELVLLYQPKVSLETGEAYSVEALLYWDHPTRGRLSPGEFIPLAEDTGMIVPMGRWVLREACTQLRAWQTDLPNPPARIAVNLSAVQLRSGKFVRDVRDTLEETGLSPSSLSIEVTEGLLTEDAYSVMGAMHELKGLGVSLALDDFGTGSSSLATLRNFPLDVLKVDKSFVDGLREGGQDVDLVGAVVTLAHTLGMKVTAEGVETLEQLSFLKSMGCEMAQGYHFARPITAGEIGEIFLSDNRW